MKCRHCAAPLDKVCLDLGSAPPSNAYLSEAMLRAPELWYPLRLLVCERCWLVQTEDYAGIDAELFERRLRLLQFVLAIAGSRMPQAYVQTA